MAELDQDTTQTEVLKNFDGDLLVTLRVDPNYDEAIINQVLRIAVYDEYQAYETYKKVLEKFGDTQPFTNIIQAEVNHYQALLPLLEKYQVPLPINDWAQKIQAPNSVLEACEVGVAAEIDNIKMYDNLISYVKGYPDILDMIYRLQAASYNNHLPAFRNSVAQHSSLKVETDTKKQQNPMANLDEMMGKMDQFSAIASKVASGELSQDDIMKLLDSDNVSLIGGAVLGAIGAGVLSGMVKDKDENKKEEDDENTKTQEETKTNEKEK